MSFVNVVNTLMGPPERVSLSKQIMHYMDNFPDDYGKDDVFHPSQMYYMCPRMEVYKRILPEGLLVEEKHSTSTMAKFHIGHALHSWYQNKYLGPMGILWGQWVCLKCGKSVEGFMPSTDGGCRDKYGHHWEYIETPVYSEEWNIKGRCDAIVIQDGVKRLVDFKTSNPAWFQKLRKPWPSATYQVQIYMWLLDIRYGEIIYIDKSADADEPVRGFPVEYSANTVNDVKGKITAYRLGLETHNLPNCLCGKSKFGVSCSEVESVVGVREAAKAWEETKVA